MYIRYFLIGGLFFFLFLSVKSYLRFLILVEGLIVRIFLVLNLGHSNSVFKVLVLLVAAAGASIGLSLMVLNSSNIGGVVYGSLGGF